MSGTQSYMVRTGSDDVGDLPVDDLRHAVEIAADYINCSEGVVEIIDAEGNVVLSQPELVARILRL